MNLDRLIYQPNQVEAWLRLHQHSLDIEAYFGGVSRHNLAVSTIALDLDDGGRALVAYVVGGARGGVRATVVLAEQRGGERIYGLHLGGFRLPVPRVPAIDGLYNLVKGLPETSGVLVQVGEVPGFGPDGRHEDGWYTRSLVAIRAAVCPDGIWAPAEAFVLREGMYVRFRDETYRLVPHRDCGFWDGYSVGRAPIRQGDLWVWRRGPISQFPVAVTTYDYGTPPSLDRHELVGAAAIPATVQVDGLGRDSSVIYPAVVAQGPFRVEHPEHEPLIVDGDEYVLFIAPGTSRPFRRGESLD